MKSLFVVLLALSAIWSAYAQAAPSSFQIWRSDNFSSPEAVYISDDGVWADIGNQVTDENAPDRSSYISRLNLQTGAFTARWSDGLDGPLGITGNQDSLIFSDRGERLVSVDINTGELQDVWMPPYEDSVLNDVTLDALGRIYVTDTRAGALWRVEDGAWTRLFMGGDFASANGVEYVDGWIYVVTSGGHGKLIRIDLETLTPILLVEDEGSLDGVVTDGRGGLILSDIPGRLLHWSEANGLTVLDEFAGEEIMLNSIGGTPDGRYIFAPHWRENQVSAFQITYPED
jgi:sugar lactone lactonase YvrE